MARVMRRSRAAYLKGANNDAPHWASFIQLCPPMGVGPFFISFFYFFLFLLALRRSRRWPRCLFPRSECVHQNPWEDRIVVSRNDVRVSKSDASTLIQELGEALSGGTA